MMTAQVKSIISADIIDFKSYYPDDDNSFMFLLQLIVGIRGEEGGDSFEVEVCTPQWLQQNNDSGSIVFGRNKLIVFEYNLERIFQRITKYCESCTGDSWKEIASKVGRIGKWEFEDYRP